MPIKPENKSLYPSNWPEIRETIRARAGDKCEECHIRNHSVGYRDEDGCFHPCGGNLVLEDYGQGINPGTSRLLDYKDAKEMADFQTETDEYDNKYFV